MDGVRASAQPFALESTALPTWSRAAFGAAAPLIERVLGLTTLGRMYTEATGSALVEDFPERALDYLGVTWTADGPIAAIPAAGPLVVVANHAFGAVDGLVLLSLIRRVRPDVKLLGNYLLSRIPELRPILLEVDPFAGPGSHVVNAKMVRRAVNWTKRGGALIVFPAGEVSNVPAPGGRLVDGPWRHGVARIIDQSGASALPVYFEGRNSRLFELAGRVHPLLRTVLLPRELLRQRGASIRVTVGEPIPAAAVCAQRGRADVVTYLRARTYGLAPDRVEPAKATNLAAVVAAIDPERLEHEIRSLPAERCLVEQGVFRVFHASAAEAPAVLQEVGRLRELTFRAAGEGTGLSTDLDDFDRWYQHLFVWHAERREVVGAYRFAATDVIATARGVRGLYTRSLFRYDLDLTGRLGPALELGRSFVRVEYQREYGPLLLLWQGIGRFLVRHPRLRRLIGPVSVSAAYHPATRDVIVNALEHPEVKSPLSPLVAPRRPYRRFALTAAPVALDDLGGLVKDLEGRGIPVLLRQYLKLGARTLAVSVDPAFSNVVDALVVVDLDAVDVKTLSRYMGADGARAFLSAPPAAPINSAA